MYIYIIMYVYIYNYVCIYIYTYDLVKLGFVILMIRTYYYLIGTYFYYLLLGPCGWHGVFNQLRSICLIGFCQYFDGSELYYEVMSGDL